MNPTLTDKQIEDIVKEIDLDGDGDINYSEFLSATLQLPSFLTDD